MSRKLGQLFSLCYSDKVVFTGSRSECEKVYAACYNILQFLNWPNDDSLVISYCPVTPPLKYDEKGGFLHV